MQAESTTDFFAAHPLLGTILTWLLILVAEISERVQVPLIVMQIFQLIVWTLAGAISVITLIGLYKKTFGNNKPE